MSEAPPDTMSDQVTTQIEKMKIEQNGVPAGDTGMTAAPVTPQPAPPVSPQPAATASETAQSPAQPQNNAQSPAQPQNNVESPAQPQNNAQSPAQPQNNAQAPASEKEKEDKDKEQSPSNLKQMFRAFSKFGDTKSDGKHITLSQSDKWMKQAKVIDGKKITTTDTGIYFKKLKSLKVNFDDYHKFLEDLAKNKKIELEEIKTKMMNCGAPCLTGVSQAGKSAAATVERLTDVSKYTGSHKQRFDATGRGRGIAGRKDLPDKSGYVSGYINKNTYDKTH